jgi:hypothetical protein
MKPSHVAALALLGWLLASPAIAMNCENDSLWDVSGSGAILEVLSGQIYTLINELVEAKHQLQLVRALTRWARYDLIALDEVGYVPLAEVGAEFPFQVIAERARRRP